MAKKRKSVPEASSRESGAYWFQSIDASYKRREKQNERYARYVRWHGGDLSDVVDPTVIATGQRRWESNLENMTNLATLEAMADLFFRMPRIVVKSPYPESQDPMFSPQLARVQTAYLKHILKTTGFRKKARRALQDALLGGMGILKITVDCELAQDEELIRAAIMEAKQEMNDFLVHGVRPVAREDQIHSIHHEIKSQYVRQADRGEIALPRPSVKYLRRHLREHESMKTTERPTETIRSASLRVRRVNPLDFFYDPTVDDMDDTSWRGCRFLMRKADVLADEKLNEEARAQIQTTTDRWVTKRYMPRVLTPGSFDVPDDMVMIYEIFDLVDQKRRWYSDGVEIPLLDEDRGDLRELQALGPFRELIFVPDPMEGNGIAPPAAFEAEQAAATHITSATVLAAIQSLPRTMFNSRDIDAATAQRIWAAGAAEFIPVEPKGAVDKPLEDCFASVPPAKIEPQNLLVKSDMIRGIERRSGLGTGKLQGGESATTATGAALGADASNAISEDRGATVDEWVEFCGGDLLKLGRRFVPKIEVVQVCGEEAATYWPDSWALEDAANLAGADIISGSSRRRNTAVDQQQSMEMVAGMAANPAFQGPSGLQMQVQMYRLIAEDSGITTLDWSAVEREAALMAQMNAAGMGAGAKPGEEEEGGEGDGGEGSAPSPAGEDQDPRAQGTTQENDIAQGIANVGGGQVTTHAGVGDKIRMLRGTAKGRAQARARG